MTDRQNINNNIAVIDSYYLILVKENGNLFMFAGEKKVQ